MQQGVTTGRSMIDSGLRRRAGVALVLGTVLVGSACGARGASFPDGQQVRDAQKVWCRVLGEIAQGRGKAGSWSELASCEGAFPTASREFIAGLASCVAKQATDPGERSFDLAHAADDCSEQVLQNFDIRGAVDPELVAARCGRLARCQKIPAEECKGAFEAMAPPEQARLGRMYNLGAQREIASCLRGGCDDDEDAAMAECYADQWKGRVWLPKD
jgi:hypothetical protein